MGTAAEAGLSHPGWLCTEVFYKVPVCQQLLQPGAGKSLYPAPQQALPSRACMVNKRV